MALSGNWIRHSGLVYLKTLMDELKAARTIDFCTHDPTSRELMSGAEGKRGVFLRGGDDSMDLSGAGDPDIDLQATLLIRVYGSHTATEGVSLALERLVASIRDKIVDNYSGFHSLDPGMQIEGVDVVEDPAFSGEQDLSALTLGVRIRSHD